MIKKIKPSSPDIYLGKTIGDNTLARIGHVNQLVDQINADSGGGAITIENGLSLFSTGLTGTGTDSTAENSIFLGEDAGFQATNASASNFFGSNTGSGANEANNSNFFGDAAGYQATNADNSNFLGSAAGRDATNASFSNFLGNTAGFEATNASNSNFFGNNAGSGSSGNNVNAFGANAGSGNALSGQTIFSNASMPSFADHTAAAAAITVALGASAGDTYLYHNQATNSIGAVRL